MIHRAARPHRLVRIMRLVALILVVGGICWLTSGILRDGAVTRKTVIVASSPVTLWSWDAKEKAFIVVVFPADTAVDAVGGYGRYSLASLWKLGFIDKREGTLLARTVSNVIALPVPWYIGRQRDALPEIKDPLADGKALFSPAGIGAFLLRRIPTNMPLWSFISLSWNLARARPDDITVYDLAKRTVTTPETLADGTTQHVLDTARLDVVLKGIFEDEQIRRENLTIALYNTTTTPFLGNQAGRVIANQGGLVVAVGNEPPQRDECVMQAKEEIETSATAERVGQLFSCRFEPITDDGRADILVKLGTKYAQTFTAEGLETH